MRILNVRRWRLWRLWRSSASGAGGGRGFWRCRRGATVLLYALGTSAFMTLAGATLEIARYTNLRSRLISSMDAAALAAVYGANDAERLSIAQRVLEANFPSRRLGLDAPRLSLFDAEERGLSDDESAIGFDVRFTVPLLLSGLLGVQDLLLQRSVLVIRPSVVEVVVVLDLSRSMSRNPADPDCVGALGTECRTRLAAMRTAMLDFLELAYGGGGGESTYMSLVFFAPAVNVGHAQRQLLLTNSGNDFDLDLRYRTFPFFGGDPLPEPSTPGDLRVDYRIPQILSLSSACFRARTRPNPQLRSVSDAPREDIPFEDMLDINDAPPGTAEHYGFEVMPFGSFIARTDTGIRPSFLDGTSGLCFDPRSGGGPASVMDAEHALVQLTNDSERLRRTVLRTARTFFGGTLIVEGMTWALRMLSPRWQGQWSDISDPYVPRRTPQWRQGLSDPDENRRVEKYIVLFSDGATEIQSDTGFMHPHGFGDYHQCGIHEYLFEDFVRQHCPTYPPPYVEYRYTLSADATPERIARCREDPECQLMPDPNAPQDRPASISRTIYLTGRGNVMSTGFLRIWPESGPDRALRESYLPRAPGDPLYINNDVGDRDAALAEFEDRLFHDLCPALEERGVQVYTVGYIDGDPSRCATTEDHAAIATNSAELRQAFRSIAERIFRSRIVEVSENF